MTTTMVRAARRRRGSRGGFTLVELMVSSALGSLVLAGVLAAFLFLCRSGLLIGHYNEMEAESRMLFQRFGRDARQASQVNWAGANSLTFTVDGAGVTYAYDAAKKQFTRSAGGKTSVLARGIADFRFSALGLNGAEISLAGSTASVNSATKMVQLDIDMARGGRVAAQASAQTVSARYVLRNKPAS